MKREDILIEASDLLKRLDDPKLRLYDATILFFRKDGDPTAHDVYQQEHIPGAAFFDHQAFSDSNNSYMYMVLDGNETGFPDRQNRDRRRLRSGSLRQWHTSQRDPGLVGPSICGSQQC